MFDIHQTIFDEDGEMDEQLARKYSEGLLEEFSTSPEGKPILEKYGALGWTDCMMDFGFQYLSVTPAKMSRRDFEEFLFDLFPRKVSTSPESAPEIVDELRAFWNFARRQYNLANAGPILKVLGADAVEELQRELANPAKYGTAKSFFMKGQQAGFDMTTQEGLDAFTMAYNSSFAAGPGEPLPGLIGDRLNPDFEDVPAPHPQLTTEQRKRKREQRKAQRQARKRNRR